MWLNFTTKYNYFFIDRKCGKDCLRRQEDRRAQSHNMVMLLDSPRQVLPHCQQRQEGLLIASLRHSSGGGIVSTLCNVIR